MITKKIRRGPTPKWPWLTMKRGDFFLLKTSKKRISNVGMANIYYRPRKFAQEIVQGGFRVWRVK